MLSTHQDAHQVYIATDGGYPHEQTMAITDDKKQVRQNYDTSIDSYVNLPVCPIYKTKVTIIFDMVWRSNVASLYWCVNWGDGGCSM